MMTGDYPSILLEQAVNQMASLPGVGRKTALRYTLSLLRRSGEEVSAFTESISRLYREIKYCSCCHNLSDQDVCPICSSAKRDHLTICVVENVQDVMSIERTGQYRGVYHVLGGVISPMDGISPTDLTIDSLLTRQATEIILALPATMEGDTTSFYIYRRLMMVNPEVRVSQIARGVAVGNDLEYTDEITLGRSLLNRTEFKA